MTNSLMKKQRKKVLVVLEYVFLLLGILALCYVAIVTIEARRYQSRAQQRLINEEATVGAYRAGMTPALSSTPSPTPGRSSFRQLREMSLIGRLEIPRIHLSTVVAEGASARVLRKALGHVPGTALPGQYGNIAIAGHRDTFFRHLGKLRSGDTINLITPNGRFRYAVERTEIVGPDDVGILQSGGDSSLTLVTCYPFYFVGPAPKRFIVHAGMLSPSARTSS
jgi:LPXTG-site transpeptidase (sortase) family protein